jgi:peptidoglycan/xylan/chitin deacetylase (PgdA/CDA1 family)
VSRSPGARRRFRGPAAHWRLLAFCLIVVLAVILFQGFATHTIGASAEPAGGNGAAAPLAQTRPVLVADGKRLVSQQPPPGRRIALTFDDGPDPRWTPQIAAVLRRNHVHATFFVIGSQAAEHPGILRMLVRDGNELGNHTFTHVALEGAASWQRRLQLDLTERR